MNDPLLLILLVGAGFCLAAAFFGGLWWTVRRLPGADHPGRLVLVSFVVRLLMLGGGFFLLSGGRPVPLFALLVGFVIGRRLLTGRVERPLLPEEEA